MRFMQATGIKQRSGFCLLGITSSRSGTARSAAHAEECSDGVPPLAACVAYSTIMFVISSRYLTNDNGLKRGEQQRRDAVATSRYLTNDNGLKRDEQRRRDAVVITLPKAALHARSAIQS